MLNDSKTRFMRYAVIGFFTFLFDLGLLWLLVEIVGVRDVISAGAAFLVAISINYFLSRKWVFQGSGRGVRSGYIYFIKIAIVGTFLVSFLMWVLLEYTPWHYLVVRTLIAGVVGVGNYFINLYFNFKVAGQEFK